VIGIGLVISSVAKTQQQAILGVFLYLAPAIILSGFATPIANMPGWAQALTLVNPIRYMMVLARGVFLEDLPWALAVHQLWPMALIGIVTLSYATWLFTRKLE
jgi:ABC-2 type transport system permease protein